MDALDIHGRLGGAMALTLGYESDALRVTDGIHRLAVVSEAAFVDLAFALTYDRWRFSLGFDSPLVVTGDSGTVGAFTFAAPAVDPGSRPDTIADTRIGVDARLLGGPASRFRLGAGAQLFVPNGDRKDYDTDGTFRAIARLLVAGDVGHFTYAGHVGVHVRPLDDAPAPGSPKGSELLFGVAGGAKFPVGAGGALAFVAGPEVYGATAFHAFFGTDGTALEALVSARLEGTRSDGMQLRLKLGAGAGIEQHFGAPAWRVVFGIDVFDHADRP